MGSVVEAVKGAAISSRVNQGRLHSGSDFELDLGGPVGICQVKTDWVGHLGQGRACVRMKTWEKA